MVRNLLRGAPSPALWLYEVVNVVELAVRKGRIPGEKALAFLESLGDLPIEIENPSRTQVFVAVRRLAGQCQPRRLSPERWRRLPLPQIVHVHAPADLGDGLPQAQLRQRVQRHVHAL